MAQETKQEEREKENKGRRRVKESRRKCFDISGQRKANGLSRSDKRQ